MQLRNDTELPDNAVATIQQTSLLGEKFVELAAPPTGASPNPLQTGDVIPIAHTGQNPEVEQVLGALSLLLNGGGVGQLQTITRELNKTLHGREGEARSVLHQVRDFSGQLDRHKQDIVAGPRRPQPALGVAEPPARHHRRHPRRDPGRAALDQHPAPRPGPDAEGPGPPQRRRHPGDQRCPRTPPSTRCGSSDPVLSQLQASGSDFVNAFQRRPDLPVRRRGRRA